MATQETMILSVSRRKEAPGFFSDLSAWCDGRTPWPRLLFLTWAVYTGICFFGDSGHVSILYWLDFGIHELGHVLTRPLVPHTVYVAAGTLAQLGVPIGAIFMFRRQDDLFAAYPFCAIWFSTNLYYTAWYVADAGTGSIPSAPIFGEPTTSDWAYLLGKMGIIHHDRAIASVLEWLAFPFFWGGVVLGGWMTWRMIRASRF